MDKIEIINMIKKFPIAEVENGEELLSKAEIIAFLSRFQEEFEVIENVDDREMAVRNYFTKALALSDKEKLPNITKAERTLKLSNGFLQDYDKIEYLKETNPNYNMTYAAIAKDLGLELVSPHKGR